MSIPRLRPGIVVAPLISCSGGITGSGGSADTSSEAQLAKNHAFRMHADGRTHFSGRCSGGIVLLEDRIDMNGHVNGAYKSRKLVCGGVAHDLTGQLSAGRDLTAWTRAPFV